jgi:hypothetical protein
MGSNIDNAERQVIEASRRGLQLFFTIPPYRNPFCVFTGNWRFNASATRSELCHVEACSWLLITALKSSSTW